MKSKIICNYSVPNNSQMSKIYKKPHIMLSQKCDNIQTKICTRGGMFSRLISKDFISNLNRIKDYEVTSRNTSLS